MRRPRPGRSGSRDSSDTPAATTATRTAPRTHVARGREPRNASTAAISSSENVTFKSIGAMVPIREDVQSVPIRDDAHAGKTAAVLSAPMSPHGRIDEGRSVGRSASPSLRGPPYGLVASVVHGPRCGNGTNRRRRTRGRETQTGSGLRSRARGGGGGGESQQAPAPRRGSASPERAANIRWSRTGIRASRPDQDAHADRSGAVSWPNSQKSKKLVVLADSAPKRKTGRPQ